MLDPSDIKRFYTRDFVPAKKKKRPRRFTGLGKGPTYGYGEAAPPDLESLTALPEIGEGPMSLERFQQMRELERSRKLRRPETGIEAWEEGGRPHRDVGLSPTGSRWIPALYRRTGERGIGPEVYGVSAGDRPWPPTGDPAEQARESRPFFSLSSRWSKENIRSLFTADLWGKVGKDLWRPFQVTDQKVDEIRKGVELAAIGGFETVTGVRIPENFGIPWLKSDDEIVNEFIEEHVGPVSKELREQAAAEVAWDETKYALYARLAQAQPGSAEQKSIDAELRFHLSEQGKTNIPQYWDERSRKWLTAQNILEDVEDAALGVNSLTTWGLAGHAVGSFATTLLGIIPSDHGKINEADPLNTLFFAVPPGQPLSMAGSAAAFFNKMRNLEKLLYARGKVPVVKPGQPATPWLTETALGGLTKLKVTPKFTDPAEVVKYLKNNQLPRALANIPGVSPIVRRISPRMVAYTREELMHIGMQMTQAEGRVNTAVSMSFLDAVGKRKDIFPYLDDSLHTVNAPGKSFHGVPLSDVLENVKKYTPDMSRKQRQWAETYRWITLDATAFAEVYGVGVVRRALAEGEAHVTRMIKGKVVKAAPKDEGTGLLSLVPKFLTRVVQRPTGPALDVGIVQTLAPGTKTGYGRGLLEGPRKFKKMADGIAEGYRYEAEEIALGVKHAYSQYAARLRLWGNWYIEGHPGIREAKVPDELVSEFKRLKSRLKLTASRIEVLSRLYKERKATTKKRLREVQKTFLDLDSLEFQQETMVSNTQGEVKKLARQVGNVRRFAEKEAARYAKAGERESKAFRDLNRLKDDLDDFQRELDEATPAYQEAMKRYKDGSFFESKLSDIPELKNVIFTETLTPTQIGSIRKAFGVKDKDAFKGYYERILEKGVQPLNAVAVAFKLTLDLGSFAIQLGIMGGAHPILFADVAKGALKTLRDPKLMPRIIAENSDLIQEFPGVAFTFGGLQQQQTAALRPGGIMDVNSWRGKAFKPFQTVWDNSMDLAAIYMLQAFKYRANTAKQKKELTEFINSIRGIQDTSAMGLSEAQRASESVFALAPRYNRGVATIAADIFRLSGTAGDPRTYETAAKALGTGVKQRSPSLRGQMARESLTRFTTSVMLLSTAYSISQGETLEEATRHLNPTHEDFLTWQIGDTKFGPGGKLRSMIKLLGNMYKNAAQDPRDMLSFNWLLEPGWRFLRGNVSPVLGTGISLVTGRNYIGDPVRDTLPHFAEEIIGGNFMPMWIESMIFEGGTGGEKAFRGGVEFFGGRAYDMTPFMRYQDFAERNYFERTQIKKTYAEMNVSERHHVRYNTKEGRELWEEAQADSLRRGKTNAYIAAVQTIKEDEEGKLRNKLALIIAEGQGMRKVREAYREYNAALGSKTETLRILGEYQTALNEIDNWPDKNLPEDIVWQRFIEEVLFPVRSDGSLKWDTLLGWDFKGQEEARKKFRDEVGEGAFSYVLEMESLMDERNPPIIREWIYDRDTHLAPYFRIQSDVNEELGVGDLFRKWSNMPKAEQEAALFKPEYQPLQDALKEAEWRRIQMRNKNPAIGYHLSKWEFEAQTRAFEELMLKMRTGVAY